MNTRRCQGSNLCIAACWFRDVRVWIALRSVVQKLKKNYAINNPSNFREIL